MSNIPNIIVFAIGNKMQICEYGWLIAHIPIDRVHDLFTIPNTEDRGDILQLAIKYKLLEIMVIILDKFPSIIIRKSNIQFLENNNLVIQLHHKSPLQIACETNDLDILNVLLRYPIDINIMFKTKFSFGSAMHHAIMYNNMKMLKILINKGGNINSRNAKGESLLHIALRYHRHKFVHWLLYKGANANIQNYKGNTILYYTRSYTMFKLCIGNKSKRFCHSNTDPNQLNEEGENVLLHILTYSLYSLKIIQLLISVNIDINSAKDIQGNSALIIACNRCPFDIIKLLIQNNAEINTLNSEGISALLLIRDNPQLTPIEKIRIIEMLINKGAWLIVGGGNFTQYTDNTFTPSLNTELQFLIRRGKIINYFDGDHIKQQLLDTISRERNHLFRINYIVFQTALVKASNEWNNSRTWDLGSRIVNPIFYNKKFSSHIALFI